MIIKNLEVGPIMANCYILGCEETKEAVVIDPGDDADQILMALAESGLTVKYIINTHGHFDHVGANKKMKSATGAPILIHEGDAPMLSRLSTDATMFGLSAENSPGPDQEISDGDIISFGNFKLKVLHTPGHSPGGVALYTEGCVFVGDTLFSGSIGRTDLPGGNYEKLISSVKNKLFTLAEDTKVYCGHGPATTIGREKAYNPFFR
ncbi:Beta-lactamase domain-containing protein [Desulfonema limicola]|uniref:Beta-lactamase domain-containing protein n=1 Tax=Desulfonema limicola TaxID=45656 RepID=A0A975B645_9BACT|nr:MBL fold metallo-hydrolase [Desulfonema limicola]QTA79504.1 Beta-lactamase domain-containing protein [Desulfonema limicola]